MMAYKQSRKSGKRKAETSDNWRRAVLFISAFLVSAFLFLRPAQSADGPRLVCGALSVASTTITWSPEEGCDVVDLYTGLGNAWQSFRSPAVSVNLTVANNARYDIFAYRSGAALALQKGPAWASGSSRGTGAGTTELALQDGAWVNAQDIAGLCSAKLCRFMGTIQVNGSGAIALAEVRLTGSFTAPRLMNLPDADSTAVVPSTATAQQFVTHIDAAGVQQKAQPQNVTGNAATATALAANGANCSAGNAAAGTDASGAAEGCFDVVTPAELQAGGILYCADAGSTDAYTCNLTPALAAYTDGMLLVFKPNTTNTGAATVNVNALGVKNIVTAANGTLADGDLVAGRRYVLFYDGTSFRMAQDFNSGGGGSISGLTTNKLPKAASPTTINDSIVEQCDSTTVGLGGCSGAAGGEVHTGLVRLTAQAAPGTPATGVGAIYIDQTSKNIAAKDDAGVVRHGVKTRSSVANQFVHSIDADGTVNTRALASADIPNNAANTTGSASQLTINGFNCAAGSAPLGVDEEGNAEGCFTVVTFDSAAVFTNKTFDAGATGNVLKMKGYLYLSHPHSCDGTGATINTTATSADYGHATFSNSADEAANYCEYLLMAPPDFDTAVAPRAKLKFALTGTDTATQRFVLSMASVADSAVPGSATLVNAINMDFAGDASGASGDVETVGWTTLTSWNSSITPEQLLRVRLARDGNATQDASTVNSTERGLVIEYGIIQ